MQTLLRTALALLFVAATAAPLVADEAANVRTMAGILAKLNHFPGDAEKKMLQAIVDDKTAGANEKTLATALLNVMHSATAADKTKLEAVAKDMKASEPVRTLAGVIGRVMHTVAEADKAAVTKLSTTK